MQQPERFTIGEWHVAVRPRIGYGGWLAWCAKGYAETGDHPLDIPDNIEVRRATGFNREQAIDRIRQEIGISLVPPRQSLTFRLINLWQNATAPQPGAPPDRKRHGTDALLLIDGHTVEFELKSVTKAKGSISTVRDFGPRHIEKWRQKHWIIGFFDSVALQRCKYGSPSDMAAWVAEKWNYVRVDFEMAKIVPALIDAGAMYQAIGQKNRYSYEDAKQLHKDQMKKAEYLSMMNLDGGYSPERMLEIFRERARYVIERGATLNNPHIPYGYFEKWATITEDHAVRLRDLVRNWIASAPLQSILQSDKP